MYNILRINKILDAEQDRLNEHNYTFLDILTTLIKIFVRKTLLASIQFDVDNVAYGWPKHESSVAIVNFLTKTIIIPKYSFQKTKLNIFK